MSRDDSKRAKVITMEDPKMGPLLDRLTAETKDAPVPDVDWAAMESKLFARVEAEAKVQRAEQRRRVSRIWVPVAAALAAAAAAVLIVRGDQTAPTETAAVEGPTSRVAATMLGRDGAGEVTIGGQPAQAGASLELGQSVETTGSATGTFERVNPGTGSRAVIWGVEPGSRATVTRVGAPLVLSLERGAVEAQVTPVPSGEAFAVDVEGTRVAVHGTHLRVARVGDRVTVDLTEGVISVGTPPRVGMTYGKTVNAPAHVEFAPRDVLGTFRVDRDPAAIRAAITLTGPVAARAPVPELLPPMPTAPPKQPIALAPQKPAPQPVQPVAAAADPNAPAIAVAALKSCLNDRPLANQAKLIVDTTLTVRTDADGKVELVQIPNVAPEVLSCATATIFKLRFPPPGSVSIPVHFEK